MRRQYAAAAAAFIVLSIAMTWPLLPNLGRAVAYPGDPFINTWILDWDWWATFHHPLSLFDANAFWPARDSLAFSENLYGVAVFLFPLRAVGVAPITAYNIALLAGLALSGFGACLLGWRITGSYAAGLAAGVFHAFVPFRFTHLTHVQHLWAGWLPLLLVALLDYIDAGERPRRRWRAAILFALFFLMNGLCNIHWLLFGTFAIGATILLFVWAGVRRWKELLITTGVAGTLLLPFLIPYWKVAKLYGMTRQWMETRAFSATWSDWLVSNVQNHTYRALADVHVDPERWLFPGALSILCAVVALFAFRRDTRAVTIGLLWVVIGVLGSLGLNSFFHSFLYDAVPGFRAIRAPARWAEIAYVGLSILIAVATAMLARRQRWIVLLVPLAFVIELRSAPIRWYMALPDAPPVYHWLAAQPLQGAVVELPIDMASSEYLYLLRSTVHHQKLVNGVSGFAPPETIRVTSMWKSSPISDDFVSELRRIGCELIIVHTDFLGPYELTTRDWLRRELRARRLTFVGRFDNGHAGDWVFSLRGGGRTTPELMTFLAGGFTPNRDTFGHLDAPQVLYRGKAFFSGYTFSPYGIRKVDLLFEAGRVRVPATLIEDKRLSALFPFYPRTPKPRFVAGLSSRPPGVSTDTDIQAEVVDGRGKHVLLPFYWFRWE